MLKIRVGGIVGDVVGRNGANVENSNSKEINKSKQMENK